MDFRSVQKCFQMRMKDATNSILLINYSHVFKDKEDQMSIYLIHFIFIFSKLVIFISFFII